MTFVAKFNMKFWLSGSRLKTIPTGTLNNSYVVLGVDSSFHGVFIIAFYDGGAAEESVHDLGSNQGRGTWL